MTRRIPAVMFLLVSVTLSAAAQAPDGWAKFSPPGSHFNVLMPGAPKGESKTSPSPAGPYTTHLFTSVSPERELYIVGWVDYAPSFKFGVQAELEANRDNFVKSAKAKLLGTTPIKLGAYPGIEFTAELPGQADVISRVYIVGRRPYQLIALTPAGSGRTPAVERFLTSFTVGAAK